MTDGKGASRTPQRKGDSLEAKCCGPYLDILWAAHLQPFLLQLGHHGLQGGLHGWLGGLGLSWLLLQLGAEALGQGVAPLTWERGQVLLRPQQLVL